MSNTTEDSFNGGEMEDPLGSVSYEINGDDDDCESSNEGLPDNGINNDDQDESKGIDQIDIPSDFIEKSVPLSSLTWEAYELSSDWSKSLKGDHGILAALDLSLPLPMCNVDISSPTKHRDILDIFSDVSLDLPPLNLDVRIDAQDEKQSYNQIACVSPEIVESTCDMPSIPAIHSGPLSDMQIESQDLDRSNTLMTPQELERMPDQGMEFEQSVGPKEPDPTHMGIYPAHLDIYPPPVIIDGKGSELTTITIMTSQGQKVFKVSTAQLCRAATLMQPLVIKTDDTTQSNTLVMLPVSKLKLISYEEQQAAKDQTQAEANRPKYKCLFCDALFHRSYKLRVHEMTKHTGRRPFQCDVPGCKWAFTDLYRLKRHASSHKKIRNFKCEQCQKSFSTIYNLRNHQASLHDPENLKHVCPVEGCEARFAASTKLHKHLFEQHRDLALSFRCEEANCSAAFYSQGGLDKHKRSHSKRLSLNLTCPIENCGRTFLCQSRLNVHLASHTGDRRYKCEFQGCMASFTTNSRLRRHKLSHAEDPQQECPHCGKRFHRKDHLKTHLLTHTSERPFKCSAPGCDYDCANKNSLILHERRHKRNSMDPLKTSMYVSGYEDVNQKNTSLVKRITNGYSEFTGNDDAEDQDLIAASMLAEESLDHNERDSLEMAGNLKFDSFVLPEAVVHHQVITTSAGGKEVSLIIPKDDIIEFAAESKVNCINGNISVDHNFTRSKTETAKKYRGSARTDIEINSKMCAKARHRQAIQKAQQSITVPLPVQSNPLLLPTNNLDDAAHTSGSALVTDPRSNENLSSIRISSQTVNTSQSPTEQRVATIPETLRVTGVDSWFLQGFACDNLSSTSDGQMASSSSSYIADRMHIVGLGEAGFDDSDIYSLGGMPCTLPCADKS